jgi:ribose transport system substrate-binding protein
MKTARAMLAATLVVGATVTAGLMTTRASAVPSSKSASSAEVAYAAGQIAKYKKIPTFQFRGKPFAARKARGKTIFTIPISSAIPYILQTDRLMQKVAQRYGVKWIEFPNQGQPSQWVQGMDQAIARKVDLIVLQGAPPPQLLGPQLAAAKKAGVPVLLSHIIDPSEPVPAGVTLAVPAPFKQAARLEADWAIAKTKGKANVLIITSNEVLPTTGIKKALANEFAKRCGSSCKTKFVNVPVVDWATKIGTEVKAALTADPGINYIIPIYDSMAFFAVPAVTEAGKQGTVKIATYNGTPDVLKFIVAKNVVVMEVGENLDWLAHANMDAAFRILAGTKVAGRKLNEFTPTRVFDATNVPQTGNPPKFNTGYGSAYKKGYAKIWSGK